MSSQLSNEILLVASSDITSLWLSQEISQMTNVSSMDNPDSNLCTKKCSLCEMLPNQSSSSCVLATPRERPFNNGGNGPATDLLLCCAQWAQSVVERFITALVIRRAQNNDMRFFYFYTKLDSFSKSKKLYSSHLAYCYLTYTLCMYLDVFPLHKFSYDMSYLYD